MKETRMEQEKQEAIFSNDLDATLKSRQNISTGVDQYKEGFGTLGLTKRGIMKKNFSTNNSKSYQTSFQVD